MELVLDGTSQTIIVEALQVSYGRINQIRNSLSSFLAGALEPISITEFGNETEALRLQISKERTDQANVVIRLDERQIRMIRTALAHARRMRAEVVENSLQKVVSPVVTKSLEAMLAPIDELLNGSTFKSVEPLPIPRLSDFISAEGRFHHETKEDLSSEQLEPKHRILLSSSLIDRDLRVYRKMCEDRRLPMAIVFADLDDFKRFNTELGEVRVDRQVLPRILNAVESAAFGHGRSYRYGGDEFVLLLPNSDTEVTASLVRQLKGSVEGISFEGVNHKPKLSAGVWITVADSHLTAGELIHFASQAKQNSKDAGKSKITIRRELGSKYVETMSG